MEILLFLGVPILEHITVMWIKSSSAYWTHMTVNLLLYFQQQGQAVIPPPQPSGQLGGQPAIMQPSSDPPPPYTEGSAQKVDTSDLERRQQV